MFSKTVVGGTFDGLHEGHKLLLESAFKVSREILVGLTSDEFAHRFRKTLKKPYKQRREDLKQYLDGLGKPYEIVEIKDTYGFATIKEDLEAIAVSEETLLRAQEINTIRYKKNLPKLTIIMVPLVTDRQGRPLSSSRD